MTSGWYVAATKPAAIEAIFYRGHVGVILYGFASSVDVVGQGSSWIGSAKRLRTGVPTAQVDAVDCRGTGVQLPHSKKPHEAMPRPKIHMNEAAVKGVGCGEGGGVSWWTMGITEARGAASAAPIIAVAG